MNDKYRKSALAIAILSIFLIVGYCVYSIILSLNLLLPRYSIDHLIDNYNNKTNEIIEVRNYAKKIFPDHQSFEIEFTKNHGFKISYPEKDFKSHHIGEVKIDSDVVDSLEKKLGWTVGTLERLKEKLDAANCISVRSGEPCRIGYQRNGLGMFFYNLFEDSIPENVRSTYNDSCRYILYTNRVVLQCEGGAILRQCFTDDR